MAAVAGLTAGSLSLASLPTLAADPMARLVGEFRRHHPSVRVDLAAPEDSRDLFDLVETGQSELGLTDARDVPTTLQVVALGPQALVFIHPPGTPPGGPANGDLGQIPFVAAPERTSTRQLLDERLAAAGVRPRLAVVTGQREAILPLVLAGAGAALVPEVLARFAEAHGAVIVQPEPPMVRQIGTRPPARAAQSSSGPVLRTNPKLSEVPEKHAPFTYLAPECEIEPHGRVLAFDADKWPIFPVDDATGHTAYSRMAGYGSADTPLDTGVR